MGTHAMYGSHSRMEDGLAFGMNSIRRHPLAEDFTPGVGCDPGELGSSVVGVHSVGLLSG